MVEIETFLFCTLMGLPLVTRTDQVQACVTNCRAFDASNKETI